MRNFDDLMNYVEPELRMELIQSELDKYAKKEDKINDIGGKALEYVQKFVEEYVKDKKDRLMFIYETKENNKIYFNVLSDVTKTEEELRAMIDVENGKVNKKFEIKDKTLYTDDKPIRKIKIFGKTFRFQEIK